MARSIEQIYQEILLAKDAEPLLREELTTRTNKRDSSSRTAIWQLWCYVFAVVAHSFERMWDVFKKDITDIIEARRLGTPEWYVTISKEFQYGNGVEFDEVNLTVLPNGIPGFVKPDGSISEEEELFIVKRASFKESQGDGLLQLKVAKDIDGRPVPLTEDEFVSFENYIDRIKFAGTFIQILSVEADKMTYDANVYFNSTLELPILTKNVEDAIKEYTDNLPFDGIFVKNELIKRVREVEGVTDVIFNSIKFSRQELVLNPTSSNSEFTTPEETVDDRNYETRAGYIEVETEGNFLNMISVSESFLR